LRDRLDLTVEVAALPPTAFKSTYGGESSATVRERVVAARDRQRDRYAGVEIRTNAELTPVLATRHCALDARVERLLEQAVVKMRLSARGYDRVRKVARTIADLAGARDIGPDHMAEALQFRMVEAD
jgi:magnesium chelatase family protein